jgi:hypothetical protein
MDVLKYNNTPFLEHYWTFLFRADATQKKSAEVTQKNLCNFCERESVYYLREKWPVVCIFG